MSISFCHWRQIVLPLLAVGLLIGNVFGQVPRTIAFQGLLTDEQGNAFASGDYSVTFRLYNVAQDGAALWTEVQTVAVLDGVANATLGRINPLTLAFDVQYWLGITVQQGGSELVPRIPLTSGPYALMAQNVPDGAVTTAKIADGSVTSSKIQQGGLEGSSIADGAITPGKLADGAVTAVKMADDAVGTGAVIDGSITADDLAAGSVGTDAIAAGAVTPVKINTTGASNGQALVFNGANLTWGAPSGSGVISEVAAGDGLTGGGNEGIVTLNVGVEAITADFIAQNAVGNSELSANAVDSENLVDDAVTGAKINHTGASSGQVLTFDGTNVVWSGTSVADGSITAAKLASSAVTTDKLDAGAVDADKLAAGAVTETKLGTGAVTTDKLDAAAVSTAKIADGAVTESKLDNQVVTNAKLGDMAVTGSKIADGAITVGKLGNLSVTAPKLGDASVTPAKIDGSTASADEVLRFNGASVEWGGVTVPNGSIDSDKIADLAVGTAKIANGAVNADKISALSVGTGQVADGAITNAKIGGFIDLGKLTTLGADEGEVVTFTGGVVTWAAVPVVPPAGDLRIDGDLEVTGTVAKGGGTFKIDHPLDPENRFLYHSFVESDEMMNVYSGNAVISSDGTAWVDLPEWFEALNADFRYQLTCIGGYAPVYISKQIEGSRFQIAGGSAGLQVSWQVTAVRNDAWARKNRMQVEVDKPAEQRGILLHPDVHDQ